MNLSALGVAGVPDVELPPSRGQSKGTSANSSNSVSAVSLTASSVGPRLARASHLARANSHGEKDNYIPVFKVLQLSMQKEAVANAYFRRRTPGLRLKALST